MDRAEIVLAQDEDYHWFRERHKTIREAYLPGKYVVIKERCIRAVWNTYAEGVRYGMKELGLPFIVQRVGEGDVPPSETIFSVILDN